MTNGDGHDGKPEQDGGQSCQPGRDANGRWLPGHCPNPLGRPKKRPKAHLNPADIWDFRNTMIDVMANGQREMMDRRAALLHKMYESAMKGKVSMQRFLYKEFERNDQRLAAARVRYEQLVMDWIINNPDSREFDFEIPLKVELEIAGLYGILSHYFPSEYPRHDQSEAGDGEV